MSESKLGKLTELPNKHRMFFNSPEALLEAQEWLEKHGLSPTHCQTLTNIHARWLHEPNKPISLSDCSRLYRCSRATALRLLMVLQKELGYSCERVTKHSGADRGYVMSRSGRRPAATAELQSAAQRSKKRQRGCSAEDRGCPVEVRGVTSARQGGDLCATPTRTSFKNEDQEPIQEQELSSVRQAATPQRVSWTKDQEQMLRAALELFSQRQAQTGGAWELDPADEQQLIATAKKALAAFERGSSPEPLETRLAEALNRAEAHAWSMGRALPHDTARHFGVHLRPEGFDPVHPTSDYGSDINCHDENYPAFAWCPDQGQWLATHPGYCGSVPTKEQPQQCEPVAAGHGLSGLDLEREKQRQLAALHALMGARQ